LQLKLVGNQVQKSCPGTRQKQRRLEDDRRNTQNDPNEDFDFVSSQADDSY